MSRPAPPEDTDPHGMLAEVFIVLLDEPVLFVYPSAEAAARDIEPPDAAAEIRAAFDDSAVPYRVQWTRPNLHSKSFVGLLKSVIQSCTPGHYSFVPTGPPDRGALVALLEHHPGTNPPEAKAELTSLLTRLREADST
jgi:hypothetical protein